MPSLCFFRNPKTWIPALAPMLIIAGYLGLGLVSVLTATVLILPTIFFTFSKQKPRHDEKSGEREVLRRDCWPRVEEAVASKALAPENKSISQQEGGNQEKEEGSQIEESMSRTPPTILSESDCLARSSSSTEDSEVHWLFQDKLFQSPDYSDGSISDEESLFEIALPSGQCLHHRQQEPKFNLQKKLPDINLSGSCFRQHGLKELLAELNEMNEEENLIEIDIFMGSIKCPRFEIEA